MHLRSLTLRGFKSFASATSIDLEPGITCVVGPNGSGKSNVVDAIAWVMGEQGAKTLRGGKMEDVIFAGTAGKAPLGRAEVELTIDNSDGALPIEYSEVTIRRTLFRSGGSEYAINGQTCRLLDIQELLSDSGIGREMHVIVGQGRLDAILHASPEDRRGFIEEAAGVLKHRRRKEKALRKLDQIQGNLQRLTDLSGELKRQLKPLGRQAEVARRAQIIQADVRDARLRLLADDVAGVQADLAQEQADEEIALAERRTAEEQLQQALAAEAEADRHVHQLAPQLHSLRERSLAATRLRERMDGLLALIRERRRSLEREQAEIALGSDPEALQREADEHAGHLDRLRSDLDTVRQRHDAAFAQVQEADAAARAERERVSAAQKAAQAYRDGLTRAEQSVLTAQRLVDSDRAALDRLQEQLEPAREEAAQAADRAREAAAETESLGDGESWLADEVAAAKRQWEESAADLQTARGVVSEHAQERASLVARCEALRAAVESRDMETLVDSSAHDGPLDRGIRVREGFESAVMALLGAYSQALILRSGVDAVGLLAQVPEGEQVRFVVPAAGTPEPADPLPGATAAVSLVRCDGPILGALGQMLDGCYVVDSLEQAADLAAGHPQLLFATTAGHVVGRGTMATGSSEKNTLALRNALGQATERLVEVEAALECATAHMERVEDTEASTREHYEDVRERARHSETQAAALRERSVHVQKQAQSAATFIEKLTADIEGQQQRLASHEAELAEGVQRRDELATSPVAEPDRGALTSLTAALEQARKELQDCSLAVRSAEERVAAAQRRVDELAAEVVQAQESLAAAIVRREQRERALQRLQVLTGLAERSLALVSAAAAEAETRWLAISDEQVTAGEAQTHARRTVEAARAVLDRVTADVHRDEVLRASKRATLDQLQEKAVEEYGLPLDELVAEYGPDQLIPVTPEEGQPEQEPRPYDRQEQTKRLKEAERGLALLGKVNPLALEEFAAMEERYAHLVTQIEDIKQSRQDLLDIVADVDERVQRVFEEAFADVAREFQHTFGRLFPGGEGRLVLTDSTDMLSTGVEVEARPPGKKIKRLSLLSGGERSLTAVAFLVALFKARPSPFYLLDEVEAALDDVNLGRLIGLLEELRETSQLLIITHQKRTMEIGDALYGVTMRGGVTQVISQRMRQLQPV